VYYINKSRRNKHDYKFVYVVRTVNSIYLATVLLERTYDYVARMQRPAGDWFYPTRFVHHFVSLDTLAKITENRRTIIDIICSSVRPALLFRSAYTQQVEWLTDSVNCLLTTM
jgi:hypothetical protein